MDSILVHRYLSNLSFAPGVLKLITERGVLATEKEVRTACDFSYSVPSYAGNGYRIVGDAGGKPVYITTGVPLKGDIQLSSTHSFPVAYTSP